METESEIADRDLLKVAYHEVSHAALYRHFDGEAVPQIWRNLDHIERNESAWAGICESTFLGLEKTPRQDKLTCIAGFIGERLALAKMDGDSIEEFELWIGEWLADAIGIGDMSDTDMAGIGADLDDDDVDEVLSILKAACNNIEVEALDLILQAKALAPTSRMRLIPTSIRKQRMDAPKGSFDAIRAFFESN